MNSTESNKSTLGVSLQVLVWFKEDSAWLLPMTQLSRGKSYFIQRNILSNHSQKTFEGPRNCHGKQTSMFLSCWFRRSQLTKTKWRLPCWRTFRKNFLQYGSNVSPGNSSSLFGLGQLHCRWSLRSSHGWWKYHCQEQWNNFLGRTCTFILIFSLWLKQPQDKSLQAKSLEVLLSTQEFLVFLIIWQKLKKRHCSLVEKLLLM